MRKCTTATAQGVDQSGPDEHGQEGIQGMEDQERKNGGNNPQPEY